MNMYDREVMEIFEQKAVEVQEKYVESLEKCEHLMDLKSRGSSEVSEDELIEAIKNLDKYRIYLKALLSVLGYVPKNFNAQFPPDLE